MVKDVAGGNCTISGKVGLYSGGHKTSQQTIRGLRGVFCFVYLFLYCVCVCVFKCLAVYDSCSLNGNHRLV